MSLPLVMTAAGPQPEAPTTILANIIAYAEAQAPGYTANLPASLIEDISSTDTGAVILCDAAQLELINSITPLGANQFILNQLGAQTGVVQGLDTNTSVYVVFSSTTPGFVINIGFTVSDGQYQYIAQDNAVIGSSGSTVPVFCVASVAGSWAVPINTVNEIITSVPAPIVVTCTNLVTGVPQAAAQTEEDYRAQVVQAQEATGVGMPSFLRTQLQNVPGVQARLISIIQGTGQWEVIVGGGDPYAVALATYNGVLDISTLIGSTLSVLGLTQANPGVVTTSLNHGFTTGQVINIAGIVGPTSLNNTPLTITVLTQTTFSIGVNTTSLPAWASGGVITPNLRNEVVSINNFPDVYVIPFVLPPQQTVGVIATWNTDSPNFISAASVSNLAKAPLAAYINTIVVGQPINLIQMSTIFTESVSSVIPTEFLDRLVWSITINGITTAPQSGTEIVVGDPESYFFCTTANISVVQG